MDRLTAYLPADRAQALLQGIAFPAIQEGTVLFADLDGFTPLTEDLLQTRGARRGAEELADILNQVYTGLIAAVDDHGGNVIGFSGDAITCWFAADDGRQALACACAMQNAMRQAPPQTGRSSLLSVKVAVVGGPIRRMIAGDPRYGLVDVLAGQTLDRLAALGEIAQPGEIVLDNATAQRWQGHLTIAAWRPTGPGDARAAVVADWQGAPSPGPAAQVAPGAPALPDATIRPWLLPAVWTRFEEGLGDFLTELRPATALFLRFTGLDYETDGGQQLTAFVSWLQQVADLYGGTLLQLTIGDKGNYAYLCFGAPIAHEDDPLRAVLTAEQLLSPPPDGPAVQTIHIGISSGTLRTGAYGSPHRRTYGALGDAVNLAARLMQRAQPGEILVDDSIVARTGSQVQWELLPPATFKGKAAPVSVARFIGRAATPAERRPARDTTLPLVGRTQELAALRAALDSALAGQGHIVLVTGEAGIGKSRLVGAFAQEAEARGLAVYRGSASSYGTHTPYLGWRPIWRALFGLDATAPLDGIQAHLVAQLAQIDPSFPERVALLNPVLNVSIPETALTQTFDARLRKESREGLLIDCLRQRGRAAGEKQSGIVLVLEDSHWLDRLSHDLLAAASRIIAALPVLIVVVARPAEDGAALWPDPSRLQGSQALQLAALTRAATRQLTEATLAALGNPEPAVPEAYLDAVLARTQGNPFYLEEVLYYLHGQGDDQLQAPQWEPDHLPLSLETMILSRVDHLPSRQQRLLRPAAIIGLEFPIPWLCGYYPQLGGSDTLRPDLTALTHSHLLRRVTGTPERTYGFHHGLTQEVLYGSLPEGTRSQLHDQLGGYLETTLGIDDSQVSLLAFHYGRSANLTKKRHYLRRAGDLAADAYANDAAIAAYEALLPLEPDPVEQSGLLRSLGAVLERVGRWEDAQRHYTQALSLAEQSADEAALARGEYIMARFLGQNGQFADSMPWSERAVDRFARLEMWEDYYNALNALGVGLMVQGEFEPAQDVLTKALSQAQAAQIISATSVLTSNLGNLFRHQSNYAQAREYYHQALVIDQKRHNLLGQSRNLMNLAATAAVQGDFRSVDAYYAESLALARQIGHKEIIGQTISGWGWVVMMAGDYAGAQPRLEEGLRIGREVGAQRLIMDNLCNLATAVLAQGKVSEAESLITEALRLSQDLQQPLALAVVLQVLSDVAREQGRVQDSLGYLHESMALVEQMGVPLLLINSVVRVALVIAAAGGDDSRHAARLIGAAVHQTSALGAAVEAYEQSLIDRTLARLEQALGAGQVRAPQEEGAAMDLAETIQCARRWTTPAALAGKEVPERLCSS